jgi:Enolase C-terminal domain-like
VAILAVKVERSIRQAVVRTPELRPADVMQMDVAHCGGITAAKKIAALAATQEIAISHIFRSDQWLSRLSFMWLGHDIKQTPFVEGRGAAAPPPYSVLLEVEYSICSLPSSPVAMIAKPTSSD